MAGQFYFAWVNAADSTFSAEFKREDEDVFELKVLHQEGDFPVATVLIRNPNIGLLSPGRKQWAWIAYEGDGGTEPLFFGRLAGQPVALGDSVIQVVLRARPRDMQTQKESLAAALKVRPYWDSIWIKPELRNDPDSALESRTLLWHFDRLSPTVTTSDIIEGEGGTETFTQDDYFEGSLSTSLGEQPLRNVRVAADVFWTQRGVGEIDMTQTVINAFHAAGSTKAGHVSSFTGQGLWEDWPEADASIGAGWYVKSSSLIRADGVTFPSQYVGVNCLYKREPTEGQTLTESDGPVTAYFALWQIRPTLTLGYEVERQRRETLEFTLSGDVQPLYTDAEDDETITLSFSSGEIGEPIDADGTDSAKPIIDVRRSQYFTTDRAAESIEYLISVARATILSRSRAVQITIEIPFERAIDLDCRKNAVIESTELPGGEATGKIISYGFSIDGSGTKGGYVTIGCCVGRGNVVAGDTGLSTYAEEDYAEEDYTQRTSLQYEAISGEVWYAPPQDAVNDDGIDLFNMTPANCVLSCSLMQGGELAQRDILGRSYRTVSDAVMTLNEEYTRVSLIMKPLTGSFEQTYYLQVSDLMIPKTIDLEAV